jgi:hypothetical protein
VYLPKRRGLLLLDSLGKSHMAHEIGSLPFALSLFSRSAGTGLPKRAFAQISVAASFAGEAI